MALSDNIRQRRAELGLTMEQLAAKVGVATQQIDKYEKNVMKPQPENFVALAKALGTTCEELVAGRGESNG